MQQLDNQTLMLAFVAITGLAVLLQAIVLIAMLVAVRKAATAINALKQDTEVVRSSMMPIIYSTRDLLSNFAELYTRVAPKVESSAADMAALTQSLRQQSAQLQSTTQEIIERVQRQSTRMDIMLTGTLDAVDRAGRFAVEVVSKPVRQFVGILASIKAVVDSFSRSGIGAAPKRSSAPPPRADKDMFV